MKKIIYIIFIVIIGIFYFKTYHVKRFIEYDYDSKYNIVELSNDFFKIDYNGKFGVMSNKGEILISPLFDTLILESNTNNVIVEKNKKFGLINSKNEIILEFEYDILTKLNNNYYKGIKNKEIFLISIGNKKIASYGKNKDIKFYNNKFFILENEKIDVYNEELSLLTTYEGDNIFKINDKVLLLQKDKEFFLIYDKLILYHENIEQIFEEYIVVNSENTKQLKKIGESNPLLQGYSSIFMNTINSVIVEKNNNFGVVSLNNEIVIPINYTRITPFYQGYYGVEKNNTFYKKDNNGNLILEDEYKCGLIDEKGKEAIEVNYEAIINFNKYFAILLDKNSIKVIELENKKEILSTDIGEIEIFDNDKIIFKEKDKILLYDKKGKIILTIKNA
ncbi:WG repeat-containing protein, partial [Fusobacterium mortiferum]|uniref:WG repeat-containing protein n=1 Tax=Fusobacterium mortiferum TaxID=850 RepID=UPI003F933204